ALAADVECWLADEPTTACPEPWTERTRRWARRHRTLMASLGVLLLTTTVALAVGVVIVSAQKAQGEQAQGETREALVRVTEEQTKTAAALEDVKAEQKKTAAALGRVTEEQTKTAAALEKSRVAEKLALDTVKSVVNDIDAQLRDKPALQGLRKKLLKTAETG